MARTQRHSGHSSGSPHFVAQIARRWRAKRASDHHARANHSSRPRTPRPSRCSHDLQSARANGTAAGPRAPMAHFTVPGTGASRSWRHDDGEWTDPLTSVLTSPSAAKGCSSPARRARRREAGCCDVDEYPPVASLAARQDGLSRDDAFRCAPTSTTRARRRARREHDVRVNESTCVLTSPSAAKGRSSPARRARRREAGCSVVDEHPPVASLAARQDGLSRDDAFRCAPTSTTRARREHDASTTRARRTRQRIDVRADEPERSEGTQFTGAAWTEARSRMLRRR